MDTPLRAPGEDPVTGDRALPAAVVLAGAWAWRLLAIAAVVGLFFLIVAQLQVVVIPMMVAILLSALLVPLSTFLQRHRWPKWLAIVVTLLVVLVVLTGLGFLVVTQIVDGFPNLLKRSYRAYDEFITFLTTGQVHVSQAQLRTYYRDAVSAFQSNTQGIVAGALSFGSSFGHFLTGLLLTVFATIILLVDGAGVWRWVVRLFPRRARASVDGAGRAGWTTLTTFVKVQIFVALVDGVGIGVIAGILHVPLAIPIAVVVFLGSFVPVVGAVVTVAVAVFVALVYDGWVIALIMLAGVLLIHLLEGHVLQPLVMGNAVKVHPLAVVFAVAGGAYLAGIAGALFAVPVVATLNVMVTFVVTRAHRKTPSPGDHDDSSLPPDLQEGPIEHV
ncbi:AI-2 transport protein TqsA [Frondihabitans sp. 762G35]|uniref:AI-2E family transporter n=1 Tax=Frondihabitans sp. 762G35 TaxID=1446794 RepID=UPI000D2285DF|nr:AI-2E family transporter [Frondihabitans sp. 762G35]ARC56218.1 AI-2 transport protein TqsA [Frondihabitans sp. 762G35]